VYGLSVFGEVFGGPLLGDGFTFRFPASDSAALDVTRTGARVGAELALGGIRIGVAGLHVQADTIPGMGLTPEAAGLGTAGTDANGLEVVARLPTGWSPLTIGGWWVGMDAPAEWLYLPTHQARAELEYHHLPLPSGNLELFARLEHVYRGPMTVGAGPAAGPALTRVPAYQATSFELSIRVVTVRAFIRWQNVLHRLNQQDLPDTMRPGQNVLYGVKWEFLN
jgi:hypothetical protein